MLIVPEFPADYEAATQGAAYDKMTDAEVGRFKYETWSSASAREFKPFNDKQRIVAEGDLANSGFCKVALEFDKVIQDLT